MQNLGGTESFKMSSRPGGGELRWGTLQKMFLLGQSLKTGHAGATSQTVATCGGEAVCVIDCQTGIVLHKYKTPGEVSARALLMQGSEQSLG